MSADILFEMQAQLASIGLVVEQIQADGKRHRCGVVDKEHGKDGSYRAFLDHNPGFLWSNFKTGESGKWFAKSEKDMTVAEREEWKERARQAHEEQEKARSQAASKAAWYMKNCPLADTGNGYLSRKGVLPFGEVRQTCHGLLVVPVFDSSGELVSVQRILPKKPESDKEDKFFLPDSATKGGFFHIPAKDGGKAGPLLIAEGYATAASLHMATGFAVLMAFNAGNLDPVGRMAREKYPGREIILCADNDCTDKDGKPRPEEKNTGVLCARKAAEAIGAKLAICPPVNGCKTDFNDLHAAEGLERVRECIEEARQEGAISATKNKYRCLNIAELINKRLPPRQNLLSPVFAVQSLSMVYAMRGVGKTHFALSCAYAVASGGGVFGRWFAPKAERVLYIDGEMPEVTMQERLQAIAISSEHDITDPDLFRIFTPDEQDTAMPNLATREGQEAVEPFLEGVRLVVVDNLATLARTGKANDEDSWAPVQTWLLSLRRRGISVLLVHHAGKNGTQRGTGAKEDILDNVIELKRPNDYKAEEGARFEVHFSKARGLYGDDVEPFEAMLSIDEHGQCSWVTRKVEDILMSQVIERVEAGLSERDIVDELQIPRSRVRSIKEKYQSQGNSLPKSKGGAGTHKTKS